MTVLVIFQDGAQIDVDEAVDWYAAIHAELARQFMAELERSVDLICKHPQMFGPVEGDARRATLRRFPYSVYYRWTAEGIIVLAVFHTSRNPSTWMARKPLP